MKIGILTFHASHNYGSMLQAYALQQTLLKWGHESKIINLRTKIQRGLIPPPLQWKHPRSSLIQFLRNPQQTWDLQRKYYRFEKFLTNDLKTTKALATHEQVGLFLQQQKYDTLIVGSDQIWNPACWDFDHSYLLDFPLPIRRIAYAPSLGSMPERISMDVQGFLRNCWVKFDALSTREQRGSNFVEKVSGRKTEVVLDPTLLLEREQYLPLCESKPIVTEPYIFYYTPREETGTFRIAQLLAQKIRRKIVVTQSHPEYIGENVIRIYDCGPREFLNIISHADYTIGKSFHLLAFSLIFSKEFLMVSRENDSRMENLLRPLHLMDRMISPDITDLHHLPAPTDYSQAQIDLQHLRQPSFEYLRASLS